MMYSSTRVAFTSTANTTTTTLTVYLIVRIQERGALGYSRLSTVGLTKRFAIGCTRVLVYSMATKLHVAAM